MDGAGDGVAKQRFSFRARVTCIAIAVYSFLLANGLASVQERLLSRG